MPRAPCCSMRRRSGSCPARPPSRTGRGCSMASVHLRSVGKRFGSVQAVDDLRLDVGDGEFFVLLGPSGAGKTTTLRLVAGLERPDAGRVLMNGEDVTDLPPAQRDCAFVFQQYSLYPHLSVFDNLAFPLRSPRRRTPEAQVRARVERVAAVLHIDGRLGRKATELSGGEMQRVAIGRALVREPQVFLMDEPLSSLDAQLRVQMRGEIRRLQQEVATTTVYVTHDQVEAMTMGDRIAVMNEGRLEQVGTPEEVYEQPANRFVGGFIGSPAMTFLDAAAVAEDGGVRLRGESVDVLLPGAAGLGGDVTVGVRPEAARLWNGGGRLAGPLRGTISYVEALGRETFVGVEVGGTTLAVFV